MVAIGVNGTIEGDVNCQNADVSGTINGKIAVNELLFLKSSGKIDGEIVTTKLVVESGATFDGSCKMGKKDIEKPNFSASSNGYSNSQTFRTAATAV